MNHSTVNATHESVKYALWLAPGVSKIPLLKILFQPLFPSSSLSLPVHLFCFLPLLLQQNPSSVTPKSLCHFLYPFSFSFCPLWPPKQPTRALFFLASSPISPPQNNSFSGWQNNKIKNKRKEEEKRKKEKKKFLPSEGSTICFNKIVILKYYS